MKNEQIIIENLNKEDLKNLIREVFSEQLANHASVDILINVQEAAAFLNLAVATIYEKTSTRSIPHYKHGKKILFKKSELLAWVESRKIKTIHEIRNEARQQIK